MGRGHPKARAWPPHLARLWGHDEYRPVRSTQYAPTLLGTLGAGGSWAAGQLGRGSRSWNLSASRINTVPENLRPSPAIRRSLPQKVKQCDVALQVCLQDPGR
ncbi:hypothetical protein CCHR01_18451 [Colletotrichum chrysophilum]|uniref:Uncharacterized protein n=1 Tax=Colletotrichum chrysophilum TaxID=1836956 RepID=A0AAD9A0Q7_9PEZI|nr:hypothetical protein CCHR01_18451 [Colletotrichum chrysophilum]